jgi:nuclear pore complex protein Nup155
LTVLVP